jgi:hypothetical protein
MIENVFLDIKNKLRVIAVDVGVEEDARPSADGVITWSGRSGMRVGVSISSLSRRGSVVAHPRI